MYKHFFFLFKIVNLKIGEGQLGKEKEAEEQATPSNPPAHIFDQLI